MTREDFLAVGMRIQDIADETGLTYQQVATALRSQTPNPYKNRRENIKILERLLARKQKEQQKGMKR